MPPKKWDDEESDDSSSSGSPVVGAGAAAASRRKFDDEEDDGDVLDSWDADDDSEAEREKERKAAEAKQKAAAAAAAAKKPKGQRIAEHQAERAQQKAGAANVEEYEETEAEKRERLRRTEQEADLAHAADMFGDIGISAGRAKSRPAAVVVDSNDPTKTIDISKLPLFQPKTKAQFETLRTTLTPIISANSKNAHYSLFLQDFTKALAKDMPSEQIKKLASTMTALGNEKMREEKAADKGGKKTKAAKTKTSLVTGRANAADTTTYDDADDFGDDDFM
ncbi:eukaryotic translation initiation factor 3 subunit J [Fusarium redolens]|uniref:Eukaryotic translation initiation factor 3 subunit J n=1 Tax=Fusarium redolens TaxID=48865 RepID=A0A9P9KXX9_FUSRE|nr:eukaryotic translation initiation factor 3 subunit J [Fusarium redolens]KAH7270454.1 eukaryotic translation initiation factor 3 subunit J [Fusarium redolens]